MRFSGVLGFRDSDRHVAVSRSDELHFMGTRREPGLAELQDVGLATTWRNNFWTRTVDQSSVNEDLYGYVSGSPWLWVPLDSGGGCSRNCTLAG